MRKVRFGRMSCESGALAEKMFSARILSKGWHGYTPVVDTGVDYVVETQRGGMKKVQITIGSPQPKVQTRLFQINKDINKVREDVDIIAIFIEAFDVDGKPDHHWFFVPTAVYDHSSMLDHHNTESVWNVNIDKLRPPLDVGHEAWWIFERKCLQRTLKVFLGD